MKKLLFLGLISLLYSFQAFSFTRIPDSVCICEAQDGMYILTKVDLSSDVRGKISLDNQSDTKMHFRYNSNNIINLKAERLFRLENIKSEWEQSEWSQNFYFFSADLISGNDAIDSYRPFLLYLLGVDNKMTIKTFGDLRKVQKNKIEYFYGADQEPTGPGTIEL